MNLSFNRLLRPISYVILLLLLAGCASEITLNLPDEPTKVVVTGHFKPEDSIQVRISLSQPIYAVGKPTLPQNIDVKVSTNGQFYARLLKKNGPAGDIFYQSTKPAMPETPYQITVDVPGYPKVQAESKIPNPIELQDINISGSAINVETLPNGKKSLRIPLELVLPPLTEGKKYFAFNLQYEVAVYDTIDGEKEYNYTAVLPAFFVTDGRTLSLLSSIAEEVVLIDENYWNDERRALYLDAVIPYNDVTEVPQKLFIEWRTLSEEFYRYHLSLSRQGTNQPLSDPDAVYNNVAEGYGNFSGYSVQYYTIEIPR